MMMRVGVFVADFLLLFEAPFFCLFVCELPCAVFVFFWLDYNRWRVVYSMWQRGSVEHSCNWRFARSFLFFLQEARIYAAV